MKAWRKHNQKQASIIQELSDEIDLVSCQQ
jgi:hypothetical protein